MVKAYVFNSEWSSEPGKRNVRVVDFTGSPKEAMHYETREEAESDALIIFERGNIEIDTLAGHKHRLSNFRVEERGPKEFVIFCEGPFVSNKTKASVESDSRSVSGE